MTRRGNPPCLISLFVFDVTRRGNPPCLISLFVFDVTRRRTSSSRLLVSTFPLPPPAPKMSVMLVFGVSLLSGHHQPRRRAVMLVFGVSTFPWPPPTPKMSVTARLQGFDLSLATTNPENERACSSSGFRPFSGHHQPRRRVVISSCK